VRNTDFALPRIFSYADVNNRGFILKYTTEFVMVTLYWERISEAEANIGKWK